jgi:Zn-dependent protease
MDPHGTGGGGIRDKFSPTEIKQLGMATIILSIAYALVLSGYIVNRDMVFFGLLFGISLVIVSTGFGLHELAHKFAAQHYGHWAEFRYSEIGLFVSLIAGFLGWIIAVPGAVYIRGRVTTEQNGIISAAGPLSNIAMTILFWGILMGGLFINFDIIIIIGFLGFMLNPIIAGFNMIPFYPLDGSKILKWNIGVFAIMAVVIVVLIYYSWIVFQF